jgi:hypothetical protein
MPLLPRPSPQPSNIMREPIDPYWWTFALTSLVQFFLFLRRLYRGIRNDELTRTIAEQHGVYETLVCAVVEQESAWDTHAIRYEPKFRAHYVASLGLPPPEEIARSISWGLMQVMGQVAREHGFSGKFLSALSDPSVGIAMGCEVLGAKISAAGNEIWRALELWNGGANPDYAAQVTARSTLQIIQTDDLDTHGLAHLVDFWRALSMAADDTPAARARPDEFRRPALTTARVSAILHSHFEERLSHENESPFFASLGWVALLGLAILAQLLIVVVAHAASVTLAWSFDYTVDPACSSTLTKNCVTGFECGTTPDGGKTLVKIGVAANPATTAASGPTNVTVQFTQGPPYGAVVYYARTMGLDGNGNVVYSSVDLAASVQMVPASPTNVAIAVK